MSGTNREPTVLIDFTDPVQGKEEWKSEKYSAITSGFKGHDGNDLKFRNYDSKDSRDLVEAVCQYVISYPQVGLRVTSKGSTGLLSLEFANRAVEFANNLGHYQKVNGRKIKLSNIALSRQVISTLERSLGFPLT